jgi:hypothetical protein
VLHGVDSRSCLSTRPSRFRVSCLRHCSMPFRASPGSSQSDATFYSAISPLKTLDARPRVPARWALTKSNSAPTGSIIMPGLTQEDQQWAQECIDRAVRSEEGA